jgi:prepilin-type N-terminal cleavage/methylation domain-containing protein
MNTRNPAASRRTVRRGFTLIELLVVVSIIALLLSILLPSLRSAKDQAKKAKCLANLHAIYLAFVCYAEDNKQELPSYWTMGQWGFRVAPGRRVSPSPYPETLGVQAVLHNGRGPTLMPNGLYKYEIRSPVYLPGDSPVWVCPANPGPSDKTGEWPGYGNTYFYRTNNGGKDDFSQPGDPDYSSTPKKTYNLDYLNRNLRLGSLALLTMDNYVYYPVLSGQGRPLRTSDYTVAAKYQRAPHRASSVKKGISNFWCANYADGHCQMNLWNH